MPVNRMSPVNKLDRDFFGGWKPELPKLSDYRFAMSPMADASIPPTIADRRANGTNAPVMDQGEIGSCVGCSTAYGVAYLRRTDRDTLSTLYSPLFQYYFARIRDGAQWKDVDAGAYIRDSMDSLREIGIPPESAWKYKPKEFAKTPTPSVKRKAAAWKLGSHWKCSGITDILRALASNCAVVGGIACYSSMFTPEVERTGRIPMPKRTDSMEGGHALYFDRYVTADRLVRFQNSWGEGWGDGGYGYVPFEYLNNPDLADDFWAMSTEAPETTPWKD